MAQQTKNPLKHKLNDDELDLSVCNYADKDVPVKDIALLKRATKLDLSNNKLTGLPKSFGTLTHLVKLDLSCNLLVELPANFGELHRLKHLDLYNNRLSHLPLSFHQLTSLRWLDLKNNQLSAQLAAAAGECLNPKECEQCARRVVQFMGRVKEHYDQERMRREQHERELMQAKLAAEEAEKERLRLEKKAKKEKKKQELREKKLESLNDHHQGDVELKTTRVEDNGVKSSKSQTGGGGGLSFVGKVNLLLLVTAVALVGGAVLLQRGGTGAGASRSGAGRALDTALQALQRVSELGTSAGDVLVSNALAAGRWAAALAAQLDSWLSGALGEPWAAVKGSASDVAGAAASLLHRTGEQALALLMYGARRGWEAAGPLWEAVCAQAARLSREGGPMLVQAGSDAWAAVQRTAPGLAAALGEAAGRLTAATWALCCAGWELVSTQVPVYATLAGERVSQLVAAVTGG